MKKRNARLDLYGEACLEMSKNVTHLYSTSFSKAIKGLGSDIRDAVYAIYGFVRLVDEVVVFDRAISEDEVNELKDSGLVVAMAVDARGKLALQWAGLKSDR